MSIWLGNKKLAGDIVKYSHNIGDIFYTSRTDTILAGAVECNGATYQTTDYTGNESIGALLASGKVPYISLSQYASDLAAHGSVRAFGWDGGSSTAFRVPTLQNVFLEAGQAASAGEYISAGLPNITGVIGQSDCAAATYNVTRTGAFYTVNANSRSMMYDRLNVTNTYGDTGFDASRSNPIYGNSSTVQPNSVKYRAMVQLFNGVTDEAVATCTGVLADVADLKDLSNITSAGKEVCANMAMPSGRYINLTLGASGTTYTAPADGYVFLEGNTTNTNGYILLGGSSCDTTSSSHAYNSKYYISATIPVRKGMAYGVWYQNLTAGRFRFVYANGAQ